MAEVPQNEVRIAAYTVPRHMLLSVLEKLVALSNVVKFELEPAGGLYKIVIHFAIMDLSTQLGGFATTIEEIVQESAKGDARRA